MPDENRAFWLGCPREPYFYFKFHKFPTTLYAVMCSTHKFQNPGPTSETHAFRIMASKSPFQSLSDSERLPTQTRSNFCTTHWHARADWWCSHCNALFHSLHTYDCDCMPQHAQSQCTPCCFINNFHVQKNRDDIRTGTGRTKFNLNIIVRLISFLLIWYQPGFLGCTLWEQKIRLKML